MPSTSSRSFRLLPSQPPGAGVPSISSPRFGIRLGLGAVLTDREIPAVTPGGNPETLCTHCGLCIKACPTGALGYGGIDTFRCLNITGALPGPSPPSSSGSWGQKCSNRF